MNRKWQKAAAMTKTCHSPWNPICAHQGVRRSIEFHIYICKYKNREREREKEREKELERERERMRERERKN